jgi:hypothetical protein
MFQSALGVGLVGARPSPVNGASKIEFERYTS